MERSLVLVKPDAIHNRQGGTIINRLEKEGLKVVALKMLHVDRELARKHYAIHQDKPFFPDLVDYITSAPIIAMVLEGEKAVERIRKVMGATDPTKAAPGTIRAELGRDIQRNAVHGSDSVENAEQEISLFFSKDEIFS